jgi:signal transduction histidine kinase/HAMP domain-containing protein
VTERPNEGETVLRMMMTLHPAIIQIRIQSPRLTDELTSQNISYPAVNVQVRDDAWVPSKIDTALHVAWLNDTLPLQHFFVMRTRFQMQNIPFVLTIVWDAKQLNTILANLPLGEKFSVSIHSATAPIVYNQSPFNPGEMHISGEHISLLQSRKQGDQTWRVLSSEFQTAQLWMIVAIPEKVILKPVNDLLLYSTSFVTGWAVIILIIGWFLSRQISRPIARLVKDVQQLSNLDFSQSIHIPAMKDLRGMGETIELMRQVLEHYQRLNVDKIILEEWKNKLFMTHSDDMIGITDGSGTFIFRNDKLDEFCSLLLPTRSFHNKSDVLTHPSIVPTNETIRDDNADGLLIHFIQSEIKVEGEFAGVNYYRVNDLSLIRNGEGLGSLLIFHDLTNERQIDKMKTEMINVIVHEMRNPVGSIMGFASILLTDQTVTEAEQIEFHQHILNGSKNLTNLINRFLDVSRLESHGVKYPKGLTDIVDITKSVAEMQKPQLLSKSLTVEFEIAGDIPEVIVSPDLFREAVSNLLSNAIKYGDSNRTIAMSLSLVDHTIVFSVTDHGYGIPPEFQQKLFTKFFRVNNPKASKETGTGLGLAYVKEIAMYHNGTIALESNADIGCKFTLTFPAVTKEPNSDNNNGGAA